MGKKKKMEEEAGQPARKVQKERNKEKRERKKGRTEGIKKGKGKEGSLIESVVAEDPDLAFRFVHPQSLTLVS